MLNSTVFRYFECVQNIKKSKFLPLDEKITKTYNNESFTLDRQNSEDKSCYLAQNQEGKDYNIQIIKCSASSLMLYESRLQELWPLVEHLPGITKKYAIDEENFVLIWEVRRFLSLEDWNSHKTNSSIPRDLRNKAIIYPEVIIRAVQDLISQIATAQRLGITIKNISPENIYMDLNESPIRPALILDEGVGIDVKIDVINERSLKYQFPLDPAIYPFAQTEIIDFWGLGVCLYSALTQKISSQIPEFVAMEEEVRSDTILSENYVPGLSELIAEFISENCNNVSAEDRLFSPLMRSWLHMFKNTNSLISFEDLEPKAVLSGLYCKDGNIIETTLEILLLKDVRIERLLSKETVIRKFIETLANYKQYKGKPELLTNAYSSMCILMKKYPWIKHEAGKLKLYHLLDNKENLAFPDVRKKIINFIQKLCKNNTLTGLITIKHNKVLKELIYTQYSEESSELLSFLPLCGKSGVKNMQMHKDYKVYPKRSELLLAISNIPIFFKRQRPEVLLRLIISIMQDSKEKEDAEFNYCFQYALEAIFAILYGGSHFHKKNNNIKCCKLVNLHHSYNVFPLFVKCLTCSEYLCISCGMSHKDEGHAFKFVLYSLTQNITCQCHQPHNKVDLPLIPTEFNQKHIELFMTGGKFKNDTFYTEDNSDKMTITSSNEIIVFNDDDQPMPVLYFEVEIKCAGKSENISIGIDETDVVYKGNNGNIMLGDEIIDKGPRFGSKDTIGIGITSGYIIYFTYNGYNLHTYIECKPIRAVRPLVIIKGKGIRAQVKFDNFLFSSQTYQVISDQMQCDLRHNIESWARFYSLILKEKLNADQNLEKIKNILKDFSKSMQIIHPPLESYRKISETTSCNKNCILL
ncbi:unnamed protein product [Blepharisma stoltei]|uniref:Protein kinase domain-containing protein n=1 Tax=Blepharisma stoltei TaxID=1481888 RepID=A0AAU9KGT5_9CILI|nr:unnamed protein product [Blepharisma stoltei]